MNDEVLQILSFGLVSELKEWLGKGVDVNAKNKHGQTLLHIAASEYQIQPEMVECLLKNGADILITDKKNYTALHAALKNQNKYDAMVRVMLENVPREKLRQLLDMKTEFLLTNGNTALHVALKCNSYVDATVLLMNGANYEIRNYAGEKPVDVASREDLRKLFQLIDASFTKARNGDVQLIEDLAKCNSVYFKSVLNCRNNDGHTIIQVLIFNEHCILVPELLGLRCAQPTNVLDLLNDKNHMNQLNELVQIVREFRQFWSQKAEAIMELSSTPADKRDESKSEIVRYKVFAFRGQKTVLSAKMACEALQKAHKVFLEYRKFEGRDKSLTADAAMKTIEEVFEVLGFNPEELFVIAGENDCYYEKLPSKYKDHIDWLLNLIHQTIDSSFYYLLRNIYSIHIFDAVKTNDVDEVKDLLKKGGSVECCDLNNQSALYYAVKKGNKKIIRLLMKSGKTLAYNGEISALILAIKNGDAKIVKLILKNIDTKDMIDFIDRQGRESTALHLAAKKGRLDIVKTLLSYGATYWIFDENGQTPLDMSTNNDVSDFLELVDDCFREAKEADVELVYKLKAMQTEDFMAVASTRNNEGHTLDAVATKAGAKNIAKIILNMMKDAKVKDE